MSYETTRPVEVRQRLDAGEWIYLDVRSVPEFEAGHVPGAYNVPLLHMTPAGMQPNAAFASVVERRFPKDAKLVLGCKIGARSGRACELLAELGYTSLANMDGGFSGRYDASGRLVEEGWSGLGFPVTRTPEAGRSWPELESR